ncbi:MAG: BamA/TamA family outer membrane protein [Flavobacteriales bacterium]|nr:BamA/TamA family outer membrane protein [Flavobacteriales bacterium]
MHWLRPVLLFCLLLGPLVLCGQDGPVPAPAGPYRVIGVVISGNRVTKERVIHREMTLAEGDTVTADDLYKRLARSEQNLRNTSLFNTVLLLPVYITPEEVLIEVRVGERWYLWPAPILQLADPNFNQFLRFMDLSRLNWGLYLNQFNFRGMNETVYLKLQFGYTRQYALRYKVPYLDRRGRWSLSVGGSWSEQAEVTIATVEGERIFHLPVDGNARIVKMADAELGFRRRHDVRHAIRLALVDAEVVDSVALRAPDYFGAGATSSTFAGLGYTFIWDTRDSRFFAHRGHYLEVKVDRIGLGNRGGIDPDITKLYAAVRRWWRTGERTTFAGSLSGKATIGPFTPYFVQEGLGYGNFVRGYEYYVVDGQDFALGKANFLFQLIKPREYYVEPVPMEAFRTLYVALYLNFFADVGYVRDRQYAAANPLANSWLVGGGTGLNLVTSYDQVFRLEYSLNGLGEGGLFLHFTQPF